jgi:hypothetical protein
VVPNLRLQETVPMQSFDLDFIVALNNITTNATSYLGSSAIQASMG